MDTHSEEDRPKLSIAVVCDAVTDCVAGSFVSTLRFSEMLDARGHKVIFIAARSPKNPTDNYHKTIRAYRFPGILLPKTEGQMRIAFGNTRRIKQILRDEKIDVVHSMIPTPLAVTTTRVANRLGIKVVAHSHTQPENLFLHMPDGPWLHFLNTHFYRYMSWIYGKAHALIYPSAFAKKRMSAITAGVPSYILSNGVDTAKYQWRPYNALVEKFALPHDSLHLLYAGRLHPEKSLHTLIAAMPHILKEHPKTHLSLAGFGHLDTVLMQQAQDLGVGDHVTFLGRVTDDEMIMAMSLCDVFVFPSLAELEGMVVLEVMSCGKPLVIANSPESASPELVNGNGLLCEPENPEDLARQVSVLLRDPDLRKAMGERSLILSQDYDINESIRQLEEIYYTVLRNETHPSL